ncbi:TadE/TadG family type IV pilus assembly protein [Reyranella sp.]|jgi:Flp pilus assembly protein TadG|uniref:TadE/TadG family type IV pilus assembly protein n=1 Tax=Reyranella sp. TaxID=1929291 RepID=UPI002F95E2E7
MLGSGSRARGAARNGGGCLGDRQSGAAVDSVTRPGASGASWVDGLSGETRRVRWRRFVQISRDTGGVSAIEFAIVAPVFVALVTGMLKFGIALSHYLILTSAAAQGAMTLALSRGTSTPYTTTTTAITNAAPSLTSSSITITTRINGTACSDDSGCSTALVAGQSAQVTLTYPCDLTVMGINYKSGGCTLSASTAQIVQ